MTTTTPHRSAPWLKRAWVLVLAGGIVMGLALGVRHVQGLFLLPITLDRGWSREVFAMAMAIQNLMWGLFQPFTGMLADRFGSAKVIFGGLFFYAVGLFFMAHAATPAAFVWSAGLCIGLALSGTTFGVVYGALSRLVSPERRSWALGLAGALGGFGQFAMVPATQGLIGGWGWSSALVAMSILMALVLPLAFPLREPARTAQPGVADMPILEAVREAFGHRGFWLLNLGFLACGFQLAFIATHLPAYLLDNGMRPADGVAALAIIALANIAGTYWCGQMGDWYRRKYLLSAIYLGRAAAMGLFLLLPISTWSLYLFAAAMGFLWLGTVPLTTGLLSQVFGVRYIGTLFGFVFFGHQLGSFLGVWLGGRVFDATHSYDLIWLGAIGLGILSAALHWPIDDREIQRAMPAMAHT
ncbi:MFS transporter [Zestomonas carbonaria]|uniref:L-lactate transporter n=1 Tax=Zestomonas carbonaria TaxID=2762745 RepID=A0A7U7EJ08_9GAMM|nr:MFS transporter [Pseudomonas carbonaria]CAD5105953.1 L-lactate transporter [Pseudomonas carbonaria]